MRPLSVKDITAAVNGRLIGESRNVTSVSTDTRKISTGSLFIALKGDRFDGHDYIPVASQNGAAAIMTERECEIATPQIVVDDTRKAYARLAAWYLSQFDIPVVGVTGSVGKTSTREMIAAAIGIKFHVHKNEGNLNNDVGLPATVLTLDDSYTAAVYEMGMNHLGEISHLAKTVCPDVGVITNIGVSHIENLGSRENILKAKLEILDGMKKGAPLILNADNDLLSEVDYENAVFIGINVPADFTAKDITRVDNTTIFTCVCEEGEFKVELPVAGVHNVYNALIAIAVASCFGISVEEAAKGLQDYQNTGLRQHIEQVGGLTLIEDCYNASPDSMKAGLDTLRSIARHRRVAVLGDMLELGDYSDEAHRVVGEYAASRADIIFTTGKQAELISERAAANGAQTLHFDTKDELAFCLTELLSDGDTVLIKASRGLKFEDIIEAIKVSNEQK